MSAPGGSTPWGLPFLGGLIAGFVVAGVVLFFLGRSRLEDVEVGWRLQTIVVAARDLAEGSTVPADALSLFAVPEQFVAPSMVRADGVQRLVGQKLAVAMQAGDPLSVSFLDTRPTVEACTPHVQQTAALLGVEGDRGVSRLLEALRATK